MGRPPQPVPAVPGLWVFGANPATRGGTAWWLPSEATQGDPSGSDPSGGDPSGASGLLIDCPAFNEANLTFLKACGAGLLVLTGRHGHGGVVRRWQQALGWPVLVQEQEAYLLPGVEQLMFFAQEHQLAGGGRLLWTPGPSPGACVLHSPGAGQGSGLLFCGRLLVPVAPARLAPLRTPGTFHWPRQLHSLGRLRDWLAARSAASPWLASSAGLAALRGEAVVPDALAQLAASSLEPLPAPAAPAFR